VGNIKITSEIESDIPKAKDHYKNARIFLAREMHTEAMLEYGKAIEKWPKFADALNDVGIIFYGKKEYSKALEHFVRAKKADESNAMFYSNAALAYLKLDIVDDAVKYLRDAVELGADKDLTISTATAERILMAARKYSALNKKKDAKQTAEIALKLERAHSKIMSELKDFINSAN